MSWALTHNRKCEICETIFNSRPSDSTRPNANDVWRCPKCRKAKDPGSEETVPHIGTFGQGAYLKVSGSGLRMKK